MNARDKAKDTHALAKFQLFKSSFILNVYDFGILEGLEI